MRDKHQTTPMNDLAFAFHPITDRVNFAILCISNWRLTRRCCGNSRAGATVDGHISRFDYYSNRNQILLRVLWFSSRTEVEQYFFAHFTAFSLASFFPSR